MGSAGRKVEVEFRIAADGQVAMSVKGQPGPSCLDVARMFEALGEVVEEERTPEFYQGAETAVANAASRAGACPPPTRPGSARS